MAAIRMLVQPDPEDPDDVAVTVPGSIAGRTCLFWLDTGAARTQVLADGALADLAPVSSESSAGAFGQHASFEIVTVDDLTVGDLVIPKLDVHRVPPDIGQQYLLGMDVLGRYCCRFRFDAGLLELSDSPAGEADLDLTVDERGHPYVQLAWDGVTASACWDSGGGITVVAKTFADAHPDLLVPLGSSSGTDSTGTQFEVPTFTLAGPTIAGVAFPSVRVAVLDLAPVNAGLKSPMDVILGAPTIRHANWLFDFPARRWAAPELTAS
jgi:predicted aspartyl protease